MRSSFLFSIILCFVLIACKNKKDVAQSSSEETKQEVIKEPAKEMKEKGEQMASAITNKYWKATEIMGKKVEMPEGMKQEPYLQLTEKGEVKGSGGCNSFFGKYTLGKGNFVSFGEMGMTEMECVFESYDNSIAEALQMTQQYILVNEEEMHLIVGKRAPLAKFEAVYFE